VTTTGPARDASAREVKVLAAVVVPPHLSVSGAARAADRLSDELSRFDDVDIHVASMADPAPAARRDRAGQSTAARLPVRVTNPLSWTERLLPNRFRTLLYRSDIPAIVGAGDYDLVHLHNPLPGLELQRVARAARRAGTPYVVSTHGFVEIADGAQVSTMSKAVRAAWRVLVQRPVSQVVGGAASVFLLSPSDASVVDQLGGRGVPTALVPNGVDPPAEGRSDALDELAVESADGEVKAFFLANHTPNKGLPVLLDAFQRLEVPFSLVVGGERRDFVDYDRWASDEPGRRITFTGALSDAQVDALFTWADLFVFPTLADTLPLVVLEAMAHGTPVVASEVGGIPFELQGDCGVLVAPGDADALAAAVTELARDPERRAGMARRARERVSDTFTWHAAARAARTAYARVLGDDRDTALRTGD